MSAVIRTLLINSEEYLCDKHYKKLLSKIVKPEDRDFNFEIVSARQISVDALMDRLRTPPMMADFRTIVVDDFEHWKKDALERFEPYFKNPDPTTHVILRAEKIDGRLKFFKTFKDNGGEVVDFKPLYDNQLSEFVLKEAQERGIKISPQAAMVLCEAVGNHLQSLVSEIEKLILYVHPKTEVTPADVEALIAAGLVHNVFKITNLIGQKNYLESLNMIRRLIEQGEPVIRLVALITTHFRKLLLVAEAKGLAPKELSSLIGVPPFFLKDYEQQARRFGSDTLRVIFKKLMTLSMGIRSSGAGSETLFEGFLQDVCVKGAI